MEIARYSDHRENPASAVLIGPDAERDPHERAGQDGGADQKAELRLCEAQILFDLHADDGEDRPGCEADREGYRRQPRARPWSAVETDALEFMSLASRTMRSSAARIPNR